MIILALAGAVMCPAFTTGCLLINYNHPIMGVIIVIYSFFKR